MNYLYTKHLGGHILRYFNLRQYFFFLCGLTLMISCNGDDDEGTCGSRCSQEQICVEGNCQCPENREACRQSCCPPNQICCTNPHGGATCCDPDQIYHQIDILWVVDDSGSMCEEQDNLTRNISSFINRLAESNVHFRLAVVTTDVQNRQGQFNDTPARTASTVCEIPPNTSDCTTVFSPIIDSDDYLVDRSDLFEELKIDDLIRDFRCIATVGTEGDGFEKGLMSAQMAMENNYGFLREEAHLAVIFLSDENDCSDNYALPRTNGYECEWRSDELVPVRDYADFFKGLKENPSKIVAAGIIASDDGIRYEEPDPVQPTCSVEGQGDAFSGYRYQEFIELFGDNGIYENICQPEYDESLIRIADKVLWSMGIDN